MKLLKQHILFFSLLTSSFSALAQSDSTQIKQSGHYLTFVSKVYLNPTIRLKTKAFKTATNLNFSALPDMGSNSMKETVPIFVGLQKLMNVLLQSDGGIRFYFNPDSIQRPFRLWHSENLWCKFEQADRDSILYYLNQPFADGNISTTNALRYETSIGKALDYVEKCIAKHPGKCGDEPQNETKEINTKPLSITVHNRVGSNYDIDTKQHDKLASNYAKVLDIFTQQQVYATSKLLVVNETDEKVALAIHSNEGDFKKQNLIIEVLKTHLQLAIDLTSTEDSIFFTLPNTLPLSDPLEVLVKYKSPKDSLTYIVGIFMVKTMERKVQKLYLVKRDLDVFPTDLVAEVQKELNNLYKNVGVTFEVDTREINGFNDDITDIVIDNSGLFSNYPASLRQYVNDVQDIFDYVDEDFYLFYGLNCTTHKGYMPRARNIGFVFNNSNVVELAETSAHEIGHGAFHFKHIFHEDELGESGQGETQNIMDYRDPIAPKDLNDVYLHQWNYIQNPAFVSWMGGDDEEGAMALEQNLMSFEGELTSDLLTKPISQNSYYLTRCNTFLDFGDVNVSVRYGSDNTRVSEININGEKYKLSNKPTIDKKGNQHLISNSSPSCSYIDFDKIELDKNYTIVNSIDYNPDEKVKFCKVSLLNSSLGVMTSFYQNIPDRYYFKTSLYALPICPEGHKIYIKDGFKEVTKDFCEQLLDKTDRGLECISINNFQDIAANNDVITLKEKIEAVLSLSNKGFYFYQFLVNPPSTFEFTPIQQKIFKDKVGFMESKDPNTKFFVLECEVNNLPYSAFGIDDLANKALAQIKALPAYANMKIGIYLLVNYNYKEGEIDKVCRRERFVVSDPSLYGDNFRYSDFANMNSTYLRASYCFTHFSKPFYSVYIFRMVNGQISHKIITNFDKPTEKNRAGLPNVVNVFVLDSKFFKNLKDWELSQGALPKNLDELMIKVEEWIDDLSNVPTLATAGQVNLDYILARDQIISLEERALNAGEDIWVINDTYSFNKLTQLALTDIKKVYAFLEKETGFFQIDDDFCAAFFSDCVITATDYYEFDIMNLVIDKIVYGVLDVLSFIPLFDVIPDCIGVLYSVARGNYAIADAYLVAVAIPVGLGTSTVARKTAVYLTDVLAEAKFVIKNVDEALPNEVRLTNAVIEYGSNTGATLAKLNNFITKLNKTKAVKFAKALAKGSRIAPEVLNGLGHFGDEVINLTGFTVSKTDNFIDVIVHFKDGKFVIGKEIINGTTTRFQELKVDDLVQIINTVPANKTVRLLSCNSEAAAAVLSAKTNRPFYASDGWVEISKTGAINSKNPFYKYQGGQKLAQQLPHSFQLTPGKHGVDFLRLGIKENENILGRILKNGNNVEYVNPSGNKLKWSGQTANDISNSITTKKNLDPSDFKNNGKIVEGNVADYLQKEGIDIQGFGVSVVRVPGTDAGDLDIVLNDYLIEVKKTYNAWSGKQDQLNKFINIDHVDYLNPYGKKVVLYIDEPINEAQKTFIKTKVPLGVIIVNSLQELKTIVQL